MQAAAPGDRFAEIRGFMQELEGLVVRSSGTQETVQAVKSSLSALIRKCPALPDQVRAPCGEHYARHLLYSDPAGRFEVVIMAWSPGQATPVHDHSGMWCVEGVVEGLIDVTRYDLKETLGPATVRMESTETIRAGLGQCGALIPPVEYHRIANPHPDLALTMHIYGGRMRSCRVFLERGDGSYDVGEKPLSFTSAHAALTLLPC